jgi:hypothetical protein
MIVRLRGREPMATISMFDQHYFALACKHSVVVGRLVRVTVSLPKVDSWTCEEPGCGKVTELRTGPYREALEREWDLCNQLDAQARERGETVIRADKENEEP